MKAKLCILLLGAVICAGCIFGDRPSNAEGKRLPDEESVEVTVDSLLADKERLNVEETTETDEDAEEITLQRLGAEAFSVLPADTVVCLGEKKAALCPVEGYAFYSLEVTSEDGSVQECELTNIFFTALVTFEWLDENRIVLEGHVNPSLHVYIVYNVKENRYDTYSGLYFTWDSSYKTLYYVEKSPYWGEETTSERILDQAGTIYFETAGTQKLVNNLVVDGTGDRIGFFVQGEKGTDFEVMDLKTLHIIYQEKDISYQNVIFSAQ